VSQFRLQPEFALGHNLSNFPDFIMRTRVACAARAVIASNLGKPGPVRLFASVYTLRRAFCLYKRLYMRRKPYLIAALHHAFLIPHVDVVSVASCSRRRAEGRAGLPCGQCRVPLNYSQSTTVCLPSVPRQASSLSRSLMTRVAKLSKSNTPSRRFGNIQPDLNGLMASKTARRGAMTGIIADPSSVPDDVVLHCSFTTS
jgi:hypothetical protein